MVIVVGVVDLGLCSKDRADLGISSSQLKLIIMENMTLNVSSEREEFFVIDIHSQRNGERNGIDIRKGVICYD